MRPVRALRSDHAAELLCATELLGFVSFVRTEHISTIKQLPINKLQTVRSYFDARRCMPLLAAPFGWHATVLGHDEELGRVRL
jgi:hypothetical protein